MLNVAVDKPPLQRNARAGDIADLGIDLLLKFFRQ
jgi:hypothetical protein